MTYFFSQILSLQILSKRYRSVPTARPFTQMATEVAESFKPGASGPSNVLPYHALPGACVPYCAQDRRSRMVGARTAATLHVSSPNTVLDFSRTV